MLRFLVALQVAVDAVRQSSPDGATPADAPAMDVDAGIARSAGMSSPRVMAGPGRGASVDRPAPR